MYVNYQDRASNKSDKGKLRPKSQKNYDYAYMILHWSRHYYINRKSWKTYKDHMSNFASSKVWPVIRIEWNRSAFSCWRDCIAWRTNTITHYDNNCLHDWLEFQQHCFIDLLSLASWLQFTYLYLKNIIVLNIILRA